MAAKKTETQDPLAVGVNEGMCENRMRDVYEKISGVNTKLSTIIGGVIVVGFVIPIFIGLLAAFANYRFGVIEKQMEKIIEKVGANKNDDANKNPEDSHAAAEGGIRSEISLDDILSPETDGKMGEIRERRTETLERRTRENGSPGPTGPGLGLRDLEK